jgi:hypothetical protein
MWPGIRRRGSQRHFLADTNFVIDLGCAIHAHGDLFSPSNVKVTTENGEVFLLGLVTPQEAQAAADVASRVRILVVIQVSEEEVPSVTFWPIRISL